MTNREYQDPPLQIGGTRRKFYYIRARQRALGESGVVRHYNRIRLGWVDGPGSITARAAARLRQEKLAEINGECYTIQSHIPFEKFVQIYRERHLPTLGAATQKKYTLHLDNHILPAFKKVRLCDVDTQAIQVLMLEKEKAGLGWWARMDVRNIISSIFTVAETFGYWVDKRNPAERVNVGKKREVREKRILNEVETRAVLERLDATHAMIVEIAIYTGLRISEVLGLRWCDIDMQAGTLRVERRYYRGDVDVPKTTRSKRTQFLGSVVDDLRIRGRNAKPDQYVFERADGSGEPLWDSGVRKALHAAAVGAKCDFPGFGPHSFRRANITFLQELAGASAIEAQKLAGHTHPDVTSEYTQVRAARRDELVQTLQRRLKGLEVIPGGKARKPREKKKVSA